MRLRCLLLVLCIAGAGLFPWRSADAADPAAPGPDVAKRIEAVGELINHSSAATQITTSGEEPALAKYATAKERYERAVQAQRAGDTEAAKRLVEEATRIMFEAVRLAKPQAVVADKKRADFNKRLDSLTDMLAAYERVRKEKHSDAGSAEVNGPLHEKLARAKSLFAAGQLDEARAALDEAYAAAKTAMERVHGGDTAVRSLHFASKEEEYRYELDRNDTHQMLLKSLVEEKRDKPELQTQTQPFVERAAELRKQAESIAASGDYAKAIETLEESTAQLIRGIRAAGVFIPG